MLKVSKLILPREGSEKTGSSSEQRWRASTIRMAGFVLKLSVSLAAGYYIYSRVASAQQELAISSLFGELAANKVLPGVLIVAFFLMVANWSFEVVKWKFIIQTRFDIRWTTAVKGVLSGVTFGVFSPNRMGEFIGRILALQPERRLTGTLLSFVNGLAQTLATFTFGVFGIIFLLHTFGTAAFGYVGTLVIQLVVFLSLVLAVVFYYRLALLSDIFSKIAWLKKFEEHIRIFWLVPASTLRMIYHLSLLRFITFVGQYLLFFYLILPQPEWFETIGASVLTLFSTTLIPFIPVPDLLLRESVALSYFELFNFNAMSVSLAVFLVWLVNVALPAVAGASILFTYRIFKGKR